jgi:hypothetical protein
MSLFSLRPSVVIRPPFARRRRLRNIAMEALGWLLIGVGLVGAVLPLHLGVPLLVVGLIIVLRTSRQARRQFIGLQRRHPKFVFPIRRLLRRDPEVLPVAWQQVLRTERFLLPRTWRPARVVRRWIFSRRRRPA